MAVINYKTFIDRYNIIRNPNNNSRKGKYSVPSSLYASYGLELHTLDYYTKLQNHSLFTLVAVETGKDDISFQVSPGINWKNSLFIHVIGHFIAKNCPIALKYSSVEISDLNFELINPTIAANMLNNLKSQSYDKFFKVKFQKRTDGTIRDMTARFGVKKGLKNTKQAFDPKSKQLVCVYDAVIRDYRSIPTDAILSISLEGKTYFVKN